jgi:hypothetical protein
VLLFSQYHAIYPYPESCGSTPALPSYLFELHFNIILTTTLTLTTGMPTKTHCVYLFSAMHVTYPTYVIIVHFIILVIFGKW